MQNGRKACCHHCRCRPWAVTILCVCQKYAVCSPGQVATASNCNLSFCSIVFSLWWCVVIANSRFSDRISWCRQPPAGFKSKMSITYQVNAILTTHFVVRRIPDLIFTHNRSLGFRSPFLWFLCRHESRAAVLLWNDYNFTWHGSSFLGFA